MASDMTCLEVRNLGELAIFGDARGGERYYVVIDINI